MGVILRIPPDLMDRLEGHLASGPDEQLAFLLASWDGATSAATDLRLVEDHAFDLQTPWHLALGDAERAAVIKWAHDNDAGLIEAHVHRYGDPAEFSGSDWNGLDAFVPHVWWRLRHRPYLALVFGETTFDGYRVEDRPRVPRTARGAADRRQARRATDWVQPSTRVDQVTIERRFDRNERFFGAEGQAKLADTAIAIIGCGGLGSIFGQQAAYLGIRRYGLVDADRVTGSSLNRLVGAVPSDVDMTHKVDVVERTVRSIEPEAEIGVVRDWLEHPDSRVLIEGADIVIGCLDDDVARLQLTALTTDARKPYFDLASDINADGDEYGGRVVFAEPGRRCVYCLGELDAEELALGGLSPEQRAARDTIYGVRKSALDRRGASVVSINGVVASLGLTELMKYVTGLRKPAITLTYLAHHGSVRRRTNEPTGPCPYCGRD